MIKVFIITITLLFSVLNISAQDNCVYDDEENCVAKGKTKTVKSKSTYGAKTSSELRTGEWLFYSSDGQLACKGIYLIEKNVSYQHGEWIYYNLENSILFKRVYNYGFISSTTFLDTGSCFYYPGDTIVLKSDSLHNINVYEKHGSLTYEYSTFLNATMQGDPSKYPRKQMKQYAYFENQFWNDSIFLLKHPSTKVCFNVPLIPVGLSNNLIQNGDFEINNSEMENGHFTAIAYSNEKFAKFWSSSNETPDIHKVDGNVFGGFRVLGVNYEVLRNELKSKLVAGKTYCLQFKIKLRKENAMAFNGISVTLSKEKMMFPSREEGFKNGVVFQSHPDIILGCKENWMVLSGEFTANGGEQYLYISNFTSKKDLKLYQVYEGEVYNMGEIYYLIDDVVLIEQTDDKICPCNVKDCVLDSSLFIEKTEEIVKEDIFENPQIGQSIILRNIQFKTASWELLPESFVTLDSLIDLMNKFPGMQVEISGHTDNRGDSKMNIELSKNRANAVLQYLVENGISEDRMVATGYGQEQAIDSNDTEEGRLNNRRVEFKVIAL